MSFVHFITNFESGSAGNRSHDLMTCSQTRWLSRVVWVEQAVVCQNVE